MPQSGLLCSLPRPCNSEMGLETLPVREAEGQGPHVLTCLESRILKSGKSKAGRREVTARGMTSVHQ